MASGNRWLILAVIFIARTSMGYQFQSIGSVGPLLVERLVIDFAMLGSLIGFYKLPGLFLAYPSGLFGRRFGDKLVAAVGMALMAVGGLVAAWADGYAAAMVGRAIAGSGAVLFNVLSAKIVADWFAGRELTLAMAIHVNSWPFGIALGLATQATIASAYSLDVMLLVSAGACVVGTLLIVVFCRSAGAAPSGQTGAAGAGLSGSDVLLVSLAAMVWLLFNAGLILVVSFGPAMLVTEGYDAEAAGRLASIGTWLGIAAIPVGGWLVQRWGRADLFMVSTLTGGAAAMAAIALLEAPYLSFVLFGIVAWAPAGAIVALPVQVLDAKRRGVGMGLFFTFYYVGIGVFPAIAGWLRDVTGDPAAPVLFAGALMLAACGFLAALRVAQRAITPTTEIATG